MKKAGEEDWKRWREGGKEGGKAGRGRWLKLCRLGCLSVYVSVVDMLENLGDEERKRSNSDGRKDSSLPPLTSRQPPSRVHGFFTGLSRPSSHPIFPSDLPGKRHSLRWLAFPKVDISLPCFCPSRARAGPGRYFRDFGVGTLGTLPPLSSFRQHCSASTGGGSGPLRLV